jgi:hypothetical protein
MYVQISIGTFLSESKATSVSWRVGDFGQEEK